MIHFGYRRAYVADLIVGTDRGVFHCKSKEVAPTMAKIHAQGLRILFICKEKALV